MIRIRRQKFIAVLIGIFAAVLVLVAALASYLPARRAAPVDPVIAMRGN